MDVSEKQESSGVSEEALTGHALMDTVASLTGLPEGLVHQELQEMLAVVGQNAGSATLDDLRKAMLLYLEELALQEEALLEPGDTVLRASDSNGIPSA